MKELLLTVLDRSSETPEIGTEDDVKSLRFGTLRKVMKKRKLDLDGSKETRQMSNASDLYFLASLCTSDISI
eukprot:scaffold1453_cov232-Alexandrium_tamarense.AAC.8